MKVNDYLAYGNKKLPRSTAILNAGAATDCPSRKLGLCQAEGACYAMKAERMYKATLPYRRRQAGLYKTVDVELFALHCLKAFERKRNKVTAFRFNEAGDFADQGQVEWFAALCMILNVNGEVACYGYTARTDLNLINLLRWSAVNVSNDQGKWTKLGANRFKMVDQESGDHFVCPGDCTQCKVCRQVKGKTIEVVKH